MTSNTRRRIATVVLTPAAALGAWALTKATGVDLVLETGAAKVGPGDVFAAALAAALAAWGAAPQSPAARRVVGHGLDRIGGVGDRAVLAR